MRLDPTSRRRSRARRPVGARLAALLVAAAAAAARADPGDVSPAQPSIPARRFDLADFGAAGDGRADDTGALKRAVAAVEAAGGGTLVVPPGTFLTGPFDLCSRIDLRLEAGATLLFSPNPRDYPAEGRRLRPQISILRRHDVEISGRGVIDGHGEAWWPAARAMRDPVTGRQYHGTTPRPPLIVFDGCWRVRVEGVTLTASPAANLAIVGGSDATVEGVAISNPPDSPNTDGIDPKGVRRVLIARCRIDTGDDCIAGGGGGRGMPEEDVLVTDCTFLHGHGCSIGSLTEGGVRGFVVRRCSFEGTDTAIRLKSARDRGGLVEDVTFEDLRMEGVGHAISINSHYEGTTTDTVVLANEPAKPAGPTTPRWRHIVIRDVAAFGCTEDAGLVAGLPEAPVEDLKLERVRIDAPRGLQIAYARGVRLDGVRILARSGPPIVAVGPVEGMAGRADSR